jgi:hypothetical protein
MLKTCTILFIVAQIVDVVTTGALLLIPGTRETNWLLSQIGGVNFIVVKVTIDILAAYLMQKYDFGKFWNSMFVFCSSVTPAWNIGTLIGISLLY